MAHSLRRDAGPGVWESLWGQGLGGVSLSSSMPVTFRMFLSQTLLFQERVLELHTWLGPCPVLAGCPGAERSPEPGCVDTPWGGQGEDRVLCWPDLGLWSSTCRSSAPLGETPGWPTSPGGAVSLPT